jgi:predicted transcriptional regulator
MSSAKFASITASLLTRKGEAQPWHATGSPDREGEKATLVWRSAAPSMSSPPPVPPPLAVPAPGPAAAAKPPLQPPVKDRSCSVRMSPHDFERLGILAVKTGVTRQQLLKESLRQFLDGKAKDYGCACLGACDQNCGQAG